MRIIVFDSGCIELYSHRSITLYQYTNINTDKLLAQNKQRVIIWNSYGLAYSRIFASHSLHETMVLATRR